jgi:hypothetical protein
MIQTHKRSTKNHFQRLKDFWDDFFKPKSLSGIFLVSGKSSYRILKIPYDGFSNLAGLGKSSSGVTKSQKMTCWGLANSGLRQAGTGRAGPGQSSSGVTKSWKMTYRGLADSGLWQPELARPRKVIFHELVILDLAKSKKRIWWNQLPKVIFWGQAIPAYTKPELKEFF